MKRFSPHLLAGVAALMLTGGGQGFGAAHSGPSCLAKDHYFEEEVWTKVGAQSCLKCHKPGGDAEDSKFILKDPSRETGSAREAALRFNHAAFATSAASMEKDESRLLLKAIGKLDHGGDDVLKPDSAGHKILQEFVRRVNGKEATPAITKVKDQPPFFEGITMLDDRALLRRATLSLGARLPAEAELAVVKEGGLRALGPILDAVMKEDAFYERLREGFNDIFLTLGVDGGEASILTYDHFSKTRNWYQNFDLSAIKDEKERRQAGYKLARQYREALLGEPMQLIEHIVRNDRPFTELVTADYIMVTPYTARGYGIFEEIKARFKNPDDPFEYIPTKLKALVGRNRADDEDSADGFYPHAGILTTFQYLRRYPTTETNRNRLRARMYYQHFLGIDVLELAARVSDAAAVTAKFKVPTMEASECVVCHKTVDPVAGLFQDYWRFEGVYGRRKEGWFTDMFGAGFEGDNLPPAERWRALQWLGERTAKDPRFATTMVEHAYYILTGRKTLLPPKALDDPLYEAKLRAYQEQRKVVEEIAGRFASTGFNLKEVFKDWVRSPFYRADGLATAAASPKRAAELADIGVARMLSPEQLERKLAAIFGKGWGRLNDGERQLAMLYGGIDSKEVTERAADPSGAMGAIQRTMANDMACKNVALDFGKPRAERRLFPAIEPGLMPDGQPATEKHLREAIAHLHHVVLGRDDGPNDAEVSRTYELFAAILADAHGRKLPAEDAYTCRAADAPRTADPTFTIRAWRGVLTYLLRQESFLYE